MFQPRPRIHQRSQRLCAPPTPRQQQATHTCPAEDPYAGIEKTRKHFLELANECFVATAMGKGRFSWFALNSYQSNPVGRMQRKRCSPAEPRSVRGAFQWLRCLQRPTASLLPSYVGSHRASALHPLANIHGGISFRSNVAYEGVSAKWLAIWPRSKVHS